MNPSSINTIAPSSPIAAPWMNTQFQQTSSTLLGDATISAIGASHPGRQRGELPKFGVTLTGAWSLHVDSRDKLPQQLLINLKFLSRCSKNTPQGKSLAKEIGQVWNCLSEAEKVTVLRGAARGVGNGNMSSADAPAKGAAMRWLRLTLKTTPAAERNRLLNFLPEQQAETIRSVVFNKPDATMVDTLYDYKAFLKANDRIGTIPDSCRGKRVAIVGSGLAGTTAGFELLKIGLQPVIIEASDRLGGRFYSQCFKNADGTDAPEFSELGGMRFPPTGAAFFHYLKMLEIETDSEFPNPGQVHTTLEFKGETIQWPAGQDAPDHPVLKTVAQDFKRFITPLVDEMEDARKDNDRDRMRQIWQRHIREYKKESFLSGVTKGLKKLGIEWSDEQKDAFGALGIGTGGFGPLYEVGFLEVLRIILNKLETKQHLITKGAGAVIDKFYSKEVEQPDGSRVSLGKNADIRLDTKVSDIAIVDGKPALSMTGPDGVSVKEEFDAVIVATTPAAMEQMKLPVQSDTGPSPLDAKVASAIQDLHMVSSSKTFFRTETKFWKDNPDIPQVILTDRTQHMLYCLSYPWTEHGVVLASYNWEDKTAEWTGMPEMERMAKIFEWLKKVSPPMASAIEQEFGASLERMKPEDIHCIDWHNEPNYLGAFKLNSPGKEVNAHEAYYDFQKGKNGNGVFIAGDSVSFNGGWAHGASATGLNAALGALEYVGGKAAKGSPMTEQNAKLYNYG